MSDTNINTLTSNQIVRGWKWYKDHLYHVESIRKETSKAFSISLFEDKEDPRIWKPGHWNWFLEKYPLNDPDIDLEIHFIKWRKLIPGWLLSDDVIRKMIKWKMQR